MSYKALLVLIVFTCWTTVTFADNDIVFPGLEGSLTIPTNLKILKNIPNGADLQNGTILSQEDLSGQEYYNRGPVCQVVMSAPYSSNPIIKAYTPIKVIEVGVGLNPSMSVVTYKLTNKLTIQCRKLTKFGLFETDDFQSALGEYIRATGAN